MSALWFEVSIAAIYVATFMRALRLPSNPLITCDSDSSLGANVNGPSVLRTPTWMANTTARYLMYFAHHQGRHIRLAFADEIGGPWRIHEPGVIPIATTPFTHHVASPDVHVDDEERRLVMYLHGHGGVAAVGIDQPTVVATSHDGLNWEVEPEPLAESYLRIFHVDGVAYGLAKGGRLYRGVDGRRFPRRFEARKQPLDYSGRHWAVHVAGDRIELFYSRWGDLPEHLLYAPLEAVGDWNKWRITERQSLLMSERDWEGVAAERKVSQPGSEHHPVCELRDPAHLLDADGRRYLFYSIAGEQGIAVAELLT